MGICNSSTKEDVKRDRERTRPNGGQAAASSQSSQQSAAAPPGDRTRGAGAQIPRPGGSGGPQGIPTGSYRDAAGVPRSLAADQPLAASYRASMEEGGGQYGTSYTNRKTKEYDLLNAIVQQTRNNFIDVSAKAGQLDEDDLLERGQKYVKNLSEIPANAMHAAAPPMPNTFPGVYYAALDLPPPSALVVKRAPTAATASSLTSSLASGLAQTRMTGEVDYGALVLILSSAAVQPSDAEFITSAASQLSTCLIESSAVAEVPPKIVLTFDELLNEK